MKKIKWAVILIAALSIMFAGCTGPFDPDTKVNLVVAGKNYIIVADRKANWHSVDVKYAAADTANPDNDKKVVIIGDTVTYYTTAISGLKVGAADNPWNDISKSADITDGPNGTKMVSVKITAAPNAGNIRVQSGNDSATQDFAIYEIIITDKNGGVKYQLSKDTKFQALPVGVISSFPDNTFLQGAGNTGANSCTLKVIK